MLSVNRTPDPSAPWAFSISVRPPPTSSQISYPLLSLSPFAVTATACESSVPAQEKLTTHHSPPAPRLASSPISNLQFQIPLGSSAFRKILPVRQSIPPPTLVLNQFQHSHIRQCATNSLKMLTLIPKHLRNARQTHAHTASRHPPKTLAIRPGRWIPPSSSHPARDYQPAALPLSLATNQPTGARIPCSTTRLGLVPLPLQCSPPNRLDSCRPIFLARRFPPCVTSSPSKQRSAFSAPANRRPFFRLPFSLSLVSTPFVGYSEGYCRLSVGQQPSPQPLVASPWRLAKSLRFYPSGRRASLAPP